jgi:hypothetical protein
VPWVAGTTIPAAAAAKANSPTTAMASRTRFWGLGTGG